MLASAPKRSHSPVSGLGRNGHLAPPELPIASHDRAAAGCGPIHKEPIMTKKPTAARAGELPPINFRTATDDRIDQLREIRAAQQRRHIELDQVLTRGLQPDSTIKELRARQ